VKNVFDIVVVGAGMVGLTLVNLLARSEQQHALRITLVDAGARPEFKRENEISLRVSAISAGSSEVLGRIGVWENIVAERSCPYRNMKVWDAAGSVDGPETLQFDAAEFAIPQLGSIVENILIQHALLTAAEQTQVSIKFDTAIASMTKAADRYSVLLGSGEKISADLLVGADGANSFVRQQAGILLKTWPYPQKAFVTHLRPEKSHNNTAWQRFLATGPIGLLPLSDGRVSIVWSTTPELADSALAATDEELQTVLAAATDDVLGKLTPSGPRGAFPLRAQHAEKYVLPGLALIGDAAHTVHPLAGQGVNLGFADAAALALVIDAALTAGDNPGDLPALRRYERSRKSDNQTMLHFVDGLNRLFSNDSAPMARLRGAGMHLFNKSGPIRTQAVQVALGIN
jgi:2-octaprenylphenol hydroxylase